MAEMSLELQKQKMLEMKAYLGEFCIKLNTGMTDLKNKLHQNRAMGFPKEIAARYEAGYYNPEKAKIDQLVQTIQSKHYEYINNVVADLKGTGDIK